jgi:uncharacterized membrane protein YbhN (UPF0104 family)
MCRGGHDAEQNDCGEHAQCRREPNRALIRLASRLHRAFIRLASRLHRAFIRPANRPHRASICVPAAAAPYRENVSAITPVHAPGLEAAQLSSQDGFERCAQPIRVSGVASAYSVAARSGPAFRRLGLPLLRVAAAVTVLWFLWRHVGTAPFKNGVRAVTWPAVVAAVTLTALTTVCSAWRWRVAARALGIGIDLRAAISSYYRSLFLNSVLVGGILGDVHRGVTHGRRSGDVVLGLRAVAWERLCGQVIQAVVTAVVLLILPSPVRPALPYVLAGVAGVAGVAGCAALVARRTGGRRGSRLTRVAGAVADDLHHGMLAPRVWPQLMLASVLVVAGHTATFVVAARVAGSTAPLGELLALLMVVQVATVIPLSIGGWGLREGAAAWAFAAAGLGAATGVTIATLYAVLMLVAVAPGAGLLLRDAVRRRSDREHAGESRRPDSAPQALEVVRD